MDEIKWVVEHGQSFGALALIVITVLGYVLRVVYNEKKACEAERLQSEIQFGDIREKLGSLDAKVEAERAGRDTHIQIIKNLQNDFLQSLIKERD